ncbi:MAG: (2Fe-2S) ferredoxin domain-containing protein [Polyangiaceae bacterium]|nr:(2Fe-2S) ferredoxin domain-containing protein [Polyangiaceae bacterium]
MALRDRYLFVCINRRPDQASRGSCAARGSEALYERLRGLVREHGLAQTTVRACSCSCLDACLTGPTIAVEPDHFLYGGVTMDDLEPIVAALARGERVDRLVIERGGSAVGKGPRAE